MRLRSIHGLKSKQLELAILAVFLLFLLWIWDKGTFYDCGIHQPDLLTRPGHLKDIWTFSLKFLCTASISVLLVHPYHHYLWIYDRLCWYGRWKWSGTCWEERYLHILCDHAGETMNLFLLSNLLVLLLFIGMFLSSSYWYRKLFSGQFTRTLVST